MTTTSAPPVEAYHSKAMPVILATEAEREAWMTGSWEEVRELQRPFEGLKVVGSLAGG